MVELGGQLCLSEEHLDELGVFREVRKYPLDDELLFEAHRPGRLGEKHLGHSAGGEFSQQLVLAEACGGRHVRGEKTSSLGESEVLAACSRPLRKEVYQQRGLRDGLA